jgi:hypothetical protein
VFYLAFSGKNMFNTVKMMDKLLQHLQIETLDYFRMENVYLDMRMRIYKRKYLVYQNANQKDHLL